MTSILVKPKQNKPTTKQQEKQPITNYLSRIPHSGSAVFLRVVGAQRHSLGETFTSTSSAYLARHGVFGREAPAKPLLCRRFWRALKPMGNLQTKGLLEGSTPSPEIANLQNLNDSFYLPRCKTSRCDFWKKLLVISGKNCWWFLEKLLVLKKNWWCFMEKLLVLHGKTVCDFWKNCWWYLEKLLVL